MPETETIPSETRTKPDLAEPISEFLRRRPNAPRWIFGGAVAILVWLGWVAFAPTVGFPALAPGAMLNRALRVGLGSRWGSVAFVAGLAIAVVAYAIAVSGGFVRPGLGSGILFGIGAWLVVGVVVMPFLGLLTPDEPVAVLRGGVILGMATPADPEAIRPTIMMFHLGVLAPLAALIAWALFGAVLGATASTVTTTGAPVTASSLVTIPEVGAEQPTPPPVRALGVLAGVVALVVLAGGLWVATRADAALSCGPPFGRRITEVIPGDVEVTAHGTICTIRGTVAGDVVVLDTSAECTKRDELTAVHVIGGTVEGSIIAEGRRCVMVWLRDGARVGGDILYGGRGDLGFLGDEEGATVEGDVVVLSGRLLATGDSTNNRIGGDLVCDGGVPVGGAGEGSATDWDGRDDGTDGTLDGAYVDC